jgi:phosphodiesterase/alkaline phosphatase D-like protein
MILDDHEVDDDWRWLDVNRRWATIPWWDMLVRWIRGRPPQERYLPRQRVIDALQAYWEYQAMHAPAMINPPILQRGQYDLDTSGALAYSFVYGAVAFFVLDTRTQRVRGRQVKSMLGPEQWHALEHWLLSVKDACPIKFLVSSSSLLYSLWTDIPRDRWSGFPLERDRLLRFLAANGIEGVYVLAGDMHAAHAVRTELYGPQGSLTVWEFCSSPFEQKPNWMGKYFYAPLRDEPVKRQECIFTASECNFGVVRVDFTAQKTQASFEIYGSRGELLGQAGKENNQAVGAV